jgi:hypothetical protein
MHVPSASVGVLIMYITIAIDGYIQFIAYGRYIQFEISCQTCGLIVFYRPKK